LKKAGAMVDDVSLYTTETVKGDATAIVEAIQNDRADWLTFTSSSTVRGFFEQVDVKRVKKARIHIASIGPATTEQLKKLGLKIDVEAKPHTTDGLVEAMCKFKKKM
jgi:uroporphyrinogen III methyltransferase / synthase